MRGPVVDPESRGGRCDDDRSARRAESPQTPWCRVPRSLRRLRGATVFLRAGDYGEVDLAGGSRERLVTLRSYPGEVAAASISELRADGVRGLRVSRLALGEVDIGPDSRRVVLSANRIRSGIAIEGGSRGIRILRNRIASPTGDGVIFATGDGEAPVVDVTIRGNRFADIGRVGVNARNFRRTIIEANSFTGVASHDGEAHPDVIRTFAGGRDLVIRGNRISDSHAQGIFVKDGAVTGLEIRDNLITGIRGGFWAVNLYDVKGATIVGNTVWGNDQGVAFQGTASGVTMVANVLQSISVTGSVTWTARRCNLTGARARRRLRGHGGRVNLERGAHRRRPRCAASAG